MEYTAKDGCYAVPCGFGARLHGSLQCDEENLGARSTRDDKLEDYSNYPNVRLPVSFRKHVYFIDAGRDFRNGR